MIGFPKITTVPKLGAPLYSISHHLILLLSVDLFYSTVDCRIAPFINQAHAKVASFNKLVRAH